MGWWEWLGDNYRQLNALSSLGFGLATAGIAYVAYRVNKQANYGLKPVLMDTFTFWSGRDDVDVTINMRFDFWNRRPYPIAVRFVAIDFEDRVKLRDKEKDRDWQVTHTRSGSIVAQKETHILEGHGIKSYNASITILHTRAKDLRCKHKVRIRYTDSLYAREQNIVLDTGIGLRNRKAPWLNYVRKDHPKE